MPIFSSANHMWYRKDWFKNAGLNPPATLNDFFNATKVLSGNGRYGFALRGGVGNYYTLVYFLANYANAETFFDGNGNSFFSKPEALEALSKYADLFKNGEAPKDSINNGYTELATNFANGVTAMMIHHLGSLQLITKTLNQENLGYAPIPLNSAGVRNISAEPQGLQMYKNAKKKDAVWKFISFVLEPDVQALMVSKHGGIPGNADTIKIESVKSNTFLSAAINMVADPKTKSFSEPYYLVEYAAYRDQQIQPDFQAILLGAKTPKDCLTKWDTDLSKMQKTYINLKKK